MVTKAGFSFDFSKGGDYLLQPGSLDRYNPEYFSIFYVDENQAAILYFFRDFAPFYPSVIAEISLERKINKSSTVAAGINYKSQAAYPVTPILYEYNASTNELSGAYSPINLKFNTIGFNLNYTVNLISYQKYRNKKG